MLRYFCFLAVILGVRSASAPFIKPCQADDANCITAAAQAAIPILAPGIPQLAVPSLDPMLLKSVKADQAGLQLSLKNTTVTGMKGCKVDGVKLDLPNGKLNVVIRCSVVLKGNYKLGGRLLVFPIQGEGRHTIKIRDIVINANTDLTTESGPDGRPHWCVSKWQHSFDVLTHASFHFENLFNGNKLIAEPVVAFVNGNWRDVMKDIAPPIVRAIVQRVVTAVNAFFAAVPTDELYIA